ncbi:response regulator transcription factor [Candidatus Peregrinibacteria bacterium]|nr:response regulator transcription factor [Candidatus Peregrinibacteria bacterium]
MKIVFTSEKSPWTTRLIHFLQKKTLEVDVFHNGREACEQCAKKSYDAIVSELFLPEMNGMQLCSTLKSNGSNIPFFMITSLRDEMMRLFAYESGVDDYSIFPFSFESFFLKLQSMAEKMASRTNLSIDDVRVDLCSREIFRGEKKIALRKLEYDLFVFLAGNQEKIFTRSTLLQKVWRREEPQESHTIDVHINSLRKKIDFKQPHLIRTVYGVGYKVGL